MENLKVKYFTKSLVALVSVALFSFSATAGTQYWDVSSDPDLQGGDGSWDAIEALWSDSIGGSDPLGIWTSSNVAVFAADGPAAVTLSAPVADGVVFDGANYTLSGGVLTVGSSGIIANVDGLIASSIAGTNGLSKQGDGMLTLTGASTYSGDTALSAGMLMLSGGSNRLPSGTDLTISGSSILDVNATTQTLSEVTLTGTIQGSGGEINASTLTAYAGTVTNAGINLTGNLQVSNDGSLAIKDGASVTTAGDAWLNSPWDGGTSHMTISGGSLTVAGAVKDNRDVYYNVAQSSGTVILGALKAGQTSTGSVGGRSGNSTYNLTGGRLTVGSIWGGDGTAWHLGITMNLGGGTLAASSSFTMAANTINLTGTGGNVTIDPDGNTITVNYAIKDSGGLILDGSGALTTTGANTYDGTTTISNGTFNLNGSHSGAGDFDLKGGTANINGSYTGDGNFNIDAGSMAIDGTHSGIGNFTVNGGNLWGTGTIQTGSVTVASGGVIGPANSDTLGTLTITNLTLEADARVACLLNGSTPTLDVKGTLDTTGTVYVDLVSTGTVSSGTYVLIKTNEMVGAEFAGFAIGTGFGSGSRLTANLVENSGNQSIDIVVVADAPIDLKWDGDVDAKWDVDTTSNWLTDPGAVASTFIAGDNLTFDDSATSFSVDAQEIVKPGSILVANDTQSYTIDGSAIDGTTGLTKDGTGVLTLTGVNTYSGATIISNGTMRSGADDAISDNSAVSVSGTLDLNGFSDTVSTLNVGGTVDIGGGELTVGTLNFDASLSGASSVIGNTLYPNAINIGQGGVTISTISGDVVKSGDLTIASGTPRSSLTMEGKIDLAGNTMTINGNNSANAYTTNTLSGNTSNDIGLLYLYADGDGKNTVWVNLVKTGGAIAADDLHIHNWRSGARVILGAHEQIADTGDLWISNGSHAYGNGSRFFLNGFNETVAGVHRTGAYRYSAQPWRSDHQLYVQNGASTDSTLTLSGAGTYDASLSSDVSHSIHFEDGGAGKLHLVKNGSGTQTIGYTKYSGTTTISAGTMIMLGSSIDHTGTTTVNGGTLLVDGTHTGGAAYTVNSGGTLAGSGSIDAAVTVASGGTIQPGQNGLSDLSTGELSMTPGAVFSVRVDGETPEIEYGQVTANGPVVLDGATLDVTLGFIPSHSPIFILDNISASTTTGVFAGIPQGGSLSLLYGGQSYAFAVSYTANATTGSVAGGNDVALYIPVGMLMIVR